jgi:hypothetical protein
MHQSLDSRLPYGDLLELRRWNALTSYNGWAQIARHDVGRDGFSHSVRWNFEVEVFGRSVRPGQFVHEDTHGFFVIPPEDQERLFEGACFIHSIECKTIITEARHNSRMSTEQMLNLFVAACPQFSQDAEVRFNRRGKFL